MVKGIAQRIKHLDMWPCDVAGTIILHLSYSLRIIFTNKLQPIIILLIYRINGNL